ncbi:Uma2 family endonuclease [Sandaracinus amylolyticus]|nr:Uma2 family endonuclease [Sandaracinus amylolyticus]
MAEPARRLATYEDLLRTPEGVRAEVIHGALQTLPSPLPKHSKVQGAIRRFVGGPFDDDDGHGGPGGWWILLEVDVRFGAHDIVRPDLVGWRRARLPRPWDTRPIDVVPDWICEVTSPSNARHDRLVKARLYAAQGVPALWLVDPELRIAEALALNADKRWVDVGRFGDGDVARIPPFEEIELDVTRLFPPLDEPDAPPET